MQYHHRQFGTVIVSILAATIIFMSLPLIRSQEFHAIQLQVVLVLLAAIVLFYALTIEIRDDTLYIRMGIGLIRKKVPLSISPRRAWYASPSTRAGASTACPA